MPSILRCAAILALADLAALTAHSEGPAALDGVKVKNTGKEPIESDEIEPATLGKGAAKTAGRKKKTGGNNARVVHAALSEKFNEGLHGDTLDLDEADHESTWETDLKKPGGAHSAAMLETTTDLNASNGAGDVLFERRGIGKTESEKAAKEAEKEAKDAAKAVRKAEKQEIRQERNARIEENLKHIATVVVSVGKEFVQNTGIGGPHALAALDAADKILAGDPAAALASAKTAATGVIEQCGGQAAILQGMKDSLTSSSLVGENVAIQKFGHDFLDTCVTASTMVQGISPETQNALANLLNDAGTADTAVTAAAASGTGTPPATPPPTHPTPPPTHPTPPPTHPPPPAR